MSDADKPTFVATFSPQQEREARLSKRFYEEAGSRKRDDGVAVMLDERELKTPGRNAVRVPTLELGDAIAAEWSSQTDHIDPSTMPRTRIITTAIDRVALDSGPAADEIARYAGTDLVCYRADEPEDLVKKQADAWDPLLEWMVDAHAVTLRPTSGIVHLGQADAELDRLRDIVGQLDPITLTALHTLVTIAGSAVIGLAVMGNRLTVEEGWDASRVDEAFQIAQWGEDAEAAERTAFHRHEFEAAAEVIQLLG